MSATPATNQPTDEVEQDEVEQALDRVLAPALREIGLALMRQAEFEPPEPDPPKDPRTPEQRYRDHRVVQMEASKRLWAAKGGQYVQGEKARNDALRSLAAAHPEEYAALLVHHRAERGLPPPSYRGNSIGGRAVVATQKATVSSPMVDAVLATPEKCKHPEALLVEEAFGVFCAGCGEALS